MSRIDDTIEAKKQKRQEFEKQGILVHPYSFQKKHTIAEVRDMLDKKVSTAGRIMSIRSHGKVIFLDLQDSTTSIQVMVRKTEVAADKFSWLKTLVDRGDFLGVTGTVMTTQTGELTILASDFEFMGKALRPIPTEFNAAEKKEARFRKRYLDMLISPETKKVLDARWLLLKEIRRFLQDKHGFVEVDTPALQPLYGGTNATPFTTHMHALDTDFYLRIASELYLKRYIVGGYDKVFDIAKDFRNEGIDQTHQPEFTMIEWYETYADYNKMMDVAENLIKHLATKIHGEAAITVGEKTIDISADWPRITMKEVLQSHADIDFDSQTDVQLQRLLTKHKIELKTEFTRGKALFALFDEIVTPQLIEPIWIIDYPRDISPLAKQHRLYPELAERFEAYIGGKELADGWSEITDPIDQRNIFENEQNNMRQGDTEAHPLDEDFLEAMEYGMPPLGGIGIGIDRLVMFLTNTWSIKEVIAFPTLRPLVSHVPSTQQNNIALNVSHHEGVSSDVLGLFPEMSYAQVRISNVTVRKTDEHLEALKKSVVSTLSNLTSEDIDAMTSIKAYRNMFKVTGTDWHKKRPSPDALMRRISQGKELYTINTAVDAYNVAVLETGIGLGGFDANSITEPVSVRLSQAGEQVLLLGDTKKTQMRAGQIVYADAEKLLTVDLNYRDNAKTKLSEKTKDIILFADGGPGISHQEVLNALQKGAEYIQQFCGGTIGDAVLYSAQGKKTMKSSQTPKNSSSALPTREESQQLLEQYIKNEKLLHHCVMVAQAMEAYARQLGEDEELWYQAGLLHDLDWEAFPDEHPNKALAELLDEYPDEMKSAIASHAPDRTGKHPDTTIEKFLFACDELSGLMHAISLMRPNGFADMQAKSVKKKLKDKSFAANVSRDDIMEGVKLIDMALDEHIAFLIEVFKK